MGRPVRRVPGLGLGRRGGRSDPDGRTAAAPVTTAAVPIGEVSVEESRFRTSGVPELDRVLGGGLVPGAAILLAGEPGVGKSTLLLEVAAQTARYQQRALYVTGEESASQVRLRADRTGGVQEQLFLAAENDLGAVLTHIEEVRPALLVVDSVQTIGASGIEGVPGGVTQVKEVAAALIRVAKTRNIATVLVGHVTKDGSIAGPRVLEHLVDVVLHFEGDRNSRFRMVRAMKNRFGPVDEVGCFDLGPDGITAVADPTGPVRRAPERHRPRHLRRGDHGGPSADARRGPGTGHAVAAGAAAPDDVRPRRLAGGDGARGAGPALRPAPARPRRVRVHRRRRQAVRAGQRPRACAIALASATLGTAPPAGVVAMGEIGLAGELRRIRDLPQRLAEAARLGFRVAVVPAERAAEPRGPRAARTREIDGMKVIEVPDVASALRLLALTKERHGLRAVDE